MLIYLIRHGETVWNAEKRYQGSCDIPLSQTGRNKLCRADFSPEVVYVTKLLRTRQTAQILFPEASLVAVPGLEEMCFGDFEGKNYIDMAEDPAYRAWVDGNCEGMCPNGEARGDFSRRICDAFEELLNRALAAGQERLVIVAHGGTQMAALERFGRPERTYHGWLSKNGAGYVLDAASWQQSRTLELVGTVDYTEEV